MKFKPYIICNLVWSLKLLFCVANFCTVATTTKKRGGIILYMGAYSQEKQIHHSLNCFAKN